VSEELWKVHITSEESFKEMKKLYPNAVFRAAIIVMAGPWWNPWSWKIICRGIPIEIRTLKGKQPPLIMWPQELP
jgi:hypothetical protein